MNNITQEIGIRRLQSAFKHIRDSDWDNSVIALSMSIVLQAMYEIAIPKYDSISSLAMKGVIKITRQIVG